MGEGGRGLREGAGGGAGWRLGESLGGSEGWGLEEGLGLAGLAHIYAHLLLIVKLLTSRAGKIVGMLFVTVVKVLALLARLAIQSSNFTGAVLAEAFGIANRACGYGQQGPGGM